MIRRKLVRAYFKMLWDDERREARKCMRKYQENGDRAYRMLANSHAEAYERLHDAWDSMKVL